MYGVPRRPQSRSGWKYRNIVKFGVYDEGKHCGGRTYRALTVVTMDSSELPCPCCAEGWAQRA